MASQPSLLGPAAPAGNLSEQRFLSLFLPLWPTDYLKRREPGLAAPLALYERIKGGMRLAAIDAEAAAKGLRTGQTVAEARALEPRLTVRELDRPQMETAFADLADWHSNASPLVSVLTDAAPFGDLVLDITGVPHLFGGETKMLGNLLTRLRTLGYTVSGATAPTIGAAWAVSHFSRSQVVEAQNLEALLDSLPIGALRLSPAQIANLTQMGLTTIGTLRHRPRKPLQARFGQSLLIRIDQAFGQIAERMTPRLPAIGNFTEHRFADPISLMEDVLAITGELAIQLCRDLERQGFGAQTFHLFLYRVDHKVMTLSLNAARLTRDAAHVTSLFRHRAQRLEGEYDAGFGIDMVRLAASSIDRLDGIQAGAFTTQTGAQDLDRLTDRLASRLGALSVLRFEPLDSHIPERATRLVPTLAPTPVRPVRHPKLNRPLRLLPAPELVLINAEVPDGLPASMIWRRQSYRLLRGAGPERLGAEWWRISERLELVAPQAPTEAQPGETPEPPPYIPQLPLHDPDAATRDYYRVEDEEGRRFWVFRQGFYGGSVPPVWYLHGFFA